MREGATPVRTCCESGSYQGMSSDMPQPLPADFAFRRWGCAACDAARMLAFVHLVAGEGARRLYVFKAAHEGRGRRSLLVFTQQPQALLGQDFRTVGGQHQLSFLAHGTILWQTGSYTIALLGLLRECSYRESIIACDERTCAHRGSLIVWVAGPVV